MTRLRLLLGALQGFDYKSIIYLLVLATGALYVSKFKVYSPFEYAALILQPVYYILVRMFIDHGVFVAVFPAVMTVIYHLGTRALRNDFSFFVESLKKQAQVITNNVYMQLSENQEKNRLIEERNKTLEIELAAYKIVEEREKNKKKKK